MKNLVFSLEATSDLTKEIIEKYNFKIIDMEYYINAEANSSLDENNLQKLYAQMRSGAKTSTSQINEEKYTSFFEELLKGNKTVVHIAFSSGLSSTCSNAQNVAEKINEKLGEKRIYVIDSLCACSGHGFLAMLASNFAKNAEKVNEVVEYANFIKHKVNHLFTVDNLNYLARGGRIKQSAAKIGNMFSIKPLMFVNKEGKLEVSGKVIGRKKALCNIVKEVESRLDKKYPEIIISHADCENDALFVSSLIEKNLCIKPTITKLSAIIGCHSGPGTLAVFFVGKDR